MSVKILKKTYFYKWFLPLENHSVILVDVNILQTLMNRYTKHWFCTILSSNGSELISCVQFQSPRYRDTATQMSSGSSSESSDTRGVRTQSLHVHLPQKFSRAQFLQRCIMQLALTELGRQAALSFPSGLTVFCLVVLYLHFRGKYKENHC